MAVLPAPVCPRCRAAAEYQVTVDMLNPPIGKIDVGYCRACACLFEHIRETNRSYDSTTWLPVCRECRQQIVVTAVDGEGADLTIRYACRDHASEAWQHTRSSDRWVRI